MKLIFHEMAKFANALDWSNTVPVLFDDELDLQLESKESYPLPFNAMVFEYARRSCFISVRDDKGDMVHIHSYHIREISPHKHVATFRGQWTLDDADSRARLLDATGSEDCFMPGVYRVCTGEDRLGLLSSPCGDFNYFKSPGWFVDSLLHVANLAVHLMYDRQNARGTIKPSSTMVGKGRKRRIYTPKDYIIIGPKTKTKTTKTFGKRNINWDHSWRVSGHWRRLPEHVKVLGKDREGNRTVEGLTWIPEHVKGDGPEIIRTRIVR